MQFPLIDVLRAVAALLVLVFHVVALGEWRFFSESAWGLPFREGWIGVDLFLVISGFVITLSAVRELGKNPDVFRWQFMQRRLKRLLPLYALTCVVYLFLVRPELLTRPAEQILIQVASHVLFLQNLFPLTHGVINGVSWSLALEMQFYVALIFSIRFIVKLGPFRTLVLLIGLSWAWRYATTLLFEPGEAIVRLQVIYTTELPGTLDAFGVGIALALLVLKGQGFWAKRLVSGWQNFLFWLVITFCFLGLTAALFLPKGEHWAHTGSIVFWRTALALGFGCALAAVMTCPLRGDGLLRPVRYLGQISYGVYLWHFPVLLSLLTLPNLRGGALFLTVLLGSVVLAAMSWHLLEKHWVRM